MALPDTKRMEEWLHGWDTGMSSKAIFHYMTLGVTGGAVPADPADLGRCLRLLEAFPEWKARMPEMAKCSERWAGLLPHWDGIVASFIEEAGGKIPPLHASWRAPATYELMKSAGV